MLEKPDLPDELIIYCLQAEYNVRAAELAFLPLGADLGTAVYRVLADDRTAYFLKLRKGFYEITVAVPLFLKSRGIQEIIPPLETISGHGWANFGDYKIILYPFVDGRNGFERELTDDHRQRLGAALRGVHSSTLPPELTRQIPRETFSRQWRETLTQFQGQIEERSFEDLTATKLAEFMHFQQDEISRLVKHAEQLASELQAERLEFVLCHTDIHGGNILISSNDELYIVDWDNPLLAPKERDLMFIGGGIDEIWKSEREEAMFYQGYGETDINLTPLAYYRYERIIEDLAVICEQLLSTDAGGADREQAYRWFTSNFEPGSTIEIADKTAKLSGTVRNKRSAFFNQLH